jgi:hypothetical protein
MDIDINFIILNLSYLLVVVALLVRDMLVLRSVIILGELGFVVYGAQFNTTILIWNLIFLVINVTQVIRLLLERRPVPIAEELQDIYKNVFTELTTREFLTFWNMGKNIVVKDGYLCRRNQVQSELLLILDGSVAVKKNGVRLAELSRGNFVAEMSFMTGEPATADVQCIDSVALVSWSQAKIHNLNHINDALLMKIQVIMGKAMSKKIEKRRVTRDLKRG